MRRYLSFALVFILWCSIAQAAVTVDAVTTGNQTTSVSHTIAADANLACLCAVSYISAGAEDVVGATIGGSAASFVQKSYNPSGDIQVEWWCRTAPPTGSQTFAWTPTNGDPWVSTIAVSFKGAALAIPGRTGTNTGNSTGSSVTIATSTTGDLAVDCVGVATAGDTIATNVGGGQTLLWGYEHDAALYSSGSSKAGGPSVSLTRSAFEINVHQWTVIGMSIEPLATSARRKVGALWLGR